MTIEIRESTADDLAAVLMVERAAFGSNEEAALVENLLNDASAAPVLSLLAFDGEAAVGHLLFTRAQLTGHEDLSVALLAPLAVVPSAQGTGIGGALIRHGHKLLADRGVALVFVLGHPDYYPRHGYRPAGRLGLQAPHTIPDAHADAWMVTTPDGAAMPPVTGTVQCADAISPVEYWRE